MKTQRLLALFTVLLAAAAVTHVVGQDSTNRNSSRLVETITNRPILIRSWTRVQDTVNGPKSEADSEPEKEQLITHTAERRWQFPLLEGNSSQSSQQSSSQTQEITATFVARNREIEPGDVESTSLSQADRSPSIDQATDKAANAADLTTATVAFPTTQFDVSPATVKSRDDWQTVDASQDSFASAPATLSEPPKVAESTPERESFVGSNLDSIEIREQTPAPIAPPAANHFKVETAPQFGMTAQRIDRTTRVPKNQSGPPAQVSLYCQGPESVNLGDEVTFVLTLDNEGGQSLDGLQVHATIPASLQVVSTTSPMGELRQVSDADSNAVVWQLPRVMAHSRSQAELRLIARKGGPVELPVNWSHQPIATVANIDVVEPRIQIEIDGPSDAWLNEESTLEVTATNVGTGTAEGLVLRTRVQGEEAGVSQIGTLPQGQAKKVSLEVTPATTGEVMVNVSAEDTFGATASAEHAMAVTARMPKLTLDLSGTQQLWLGESCTLEVKLTNSGSGDAENVALQVNMGNSPERSSNLGTIRAGESKLLAIDVKPTVAGDNLVVVAADNQANSRAVAKHNLIVTARAPALAVTIDGPKQLHLGQGATLSMTVRNSGNGPAENVELSVQLDDQAAKTLEIGTIDADSVKRLELDVSPTRVGTTSILVAATSQGIDANATHKIDVTSAKLEITATGPQQRFAGAVGNYSFTISNSGNATAENVKVAALLPVGAELISSTQASKIGRELQWAIGSLKANESRTFGMSLQLSQPGEQTLKFLSKADKIKSASAQYDIQVRTVANLSLSVKEPQGPLPVGNVVTYTITVQNDGTVAAKGVQVIAQLDRGLQIVSSGGVQSAGQVTFPAIVALQPGESKQFHLTANPSAEGSQKYRVEVNSANPPAQRATEGSTFFYNSQ